MESQSKTNHCIQITEAFKTAYTDQPICALKSKHIIYDFFGDELLKLKLEDGDFLFVCKPWTKNPAPFQDKTIIRKEFTYQIVESKDIEDVYQRIEFIRSRMRNR
mgnify:CR=1 FL=1